jgi:hypothetical protein
MNRELQIKRAPSVIHLVVARTFHPNTPAVGAHDPAINGQAEARAAALEYGFAGRVQRHRTNLIELLEYQLVVLGVKADAGVLNADLRTRHAAVERNRPGANGDTAAVGGVLDGVDNHVVQRLLNEGWVGIECGRVGREVSGQGRFGRQINGGALAREGSGECSVYAKRRSVCAMRGGMAGGAPPAAGASSP